MKLDPCHGSAIRMPEGIGESILLILIAFI